MKFNPANKIQDLRQFGEFGGVNPSITDSSTYTFLKAHDMVETFQGHDDTHFLYSRHWNPSNRYLAEAVSCMEDTEASWITSSGMSAITCTILHLCNSGDHLITSVTTYGGTFAFFKNYLSKFNIEVTFVNIEDLESIKKSIKPNTRLIYTESITNPLLQVSDIQELSVIAREHQIKLVIDNTFSPMIITPANLGADITVHSLTKFINGKNDCVAGAICSSKEFIRSLSDVNRGTAMLLGPVLDSIRSASILKNMSTLHIRIQQHSKNAFYLAGKIRELGLKVIYPGFEDHPHHELLKSMMNPDFGYGGMMSVDFETTEKAFEIMQKMQEYDVGYLAVSLGYFKTLFSNSGKSTSSEIPLDVQKEMGLSEGLVRFSVGLDHDIERTFQRIKKSMEELKII